MRERSLEMESKGTHEQGTGEEDHGSFVELLREMVAEVMHDQQADDRSLLRRTRDAVAHKAPRFRLAARSASEDVIRWMHRGGPWRAFLVSAVGIVVFVSLAALATFMLFFFTATANAIAIGFLMSLSGVGAFIAIFFMMLTAIYVGALLTAAVAISSIAFFTISAVVLVTGWVVFWWFLWHLAKKAGDMLRGTVAMTASALSTVSASGSTQIISIEKRTSQ